MTGNVTSIARPYAIAAFECALAENALPAWEEFLQTAACVSQDPLMVRIMSTPSVSTTQLADLFCDVLQSELDKEKKNFLCLLAEHKRFPVLAEMAKQFAHLRAEREKQVTVDVISAVALDTQQQTKFVEALTKRLQLKVTLNCSVDPELLGGAVVRMGDNVIDGSVRGKLQRLFDFI